MTLSLAKLRRVPAWDALMALLCDVSMVLAIVSLFQEDRRRYSAAATTVWIGLELLRRVDRLPWSWAGLAILLLNIRGVVLDEGPTPISHMDYVLMILAFLVGFGRSERRWLRTSALICGACLAGILLNAEIIWDYSWWGVEYQTNTLTKNQTALLAGLAALSGVMAALLSRTRLRGGIWMLMIPAVLGCLILARATLSRAGLALVPLSLVAAGLLVGRHRLKASLCGWFQRLPVQRRRHLLVRGAIALGVALGGGALTFLLHPAGLPARLGHLYGADNLANDMGRLRVWQCYAGLPFKGENRFLYGVGYQNSWEKWCSPEVIGRFLTHSHNFLLQIWGDSGVIAFAFIAVCLLLILARMVRNASPPSHRDPARPWPWAMALSSTSIVLYLLAFNSVELGMLKVPILTALFGHFLGSVFYSQLPSGEGENGI